MKLSLPPIVTSFELSWSRQPIPLKSQVLPADALLQRVKATRLQIDFPVIKIIKCYFLLLQVQTASEDGEDKRILDIKR